MLLVNKSEFKLTVGEPPMNLVTFSQNGGACFCHYKSILPII